MKKRTKIIAIVGATIFVAAAIFFIFFNGEVGDDIIVSPQKGKFVISVTASGELRAEQSVDIRGPNNTRSLGIYQMTISDLIEEGTVVKTGDYVAELDKTPVMTSLKEIELSVLKYRSQYEQSQIDSTLNLSKARDNLDNLKFSTEEQKLQLQQSQYEPPAVIKQAEINLERAKRQYNQAVKNYASEVQKSVTNLTIVGADLSREQQKLNMLMETMGEFTVVAPADGMVIYNKGWDGSKTVIGSQISAWDPVVAKLPDLTKMQSVTYINEIDISKIKKDQEVIIRLDADPDKKLKGKIIRAANIGEDLRGSDSKVFETVIAVSDKDTTLLPAMTTSNEIIINTFNDVLFISQECLHTYENEKTKEKYHYVIVKNGSRAEKHEVELGEFNSNDVIIKQGVKLEDKLLLNVPENEEKLKIIRLKKSSTKAKASTKPTKSKSNETH